MAEHDLGVTHGGEEGLLGEDEVKPVVFARYLDGDTLRQIARRLNEREVPTAEGCHWAPQSVRAVVSSRHVTGIRVFRGQDFGDGNWPVIIDRGTWTEAQDRRAYRASPYARPFRFYLLRGLVMCKKCAKPMAGAANNHKPYYACNRRDDSQVAQCTRRIDALKLEAFVTDAAVELLTRLDVRGAPIATLAL